MEFKEKVMELVARIESLGELQTEEATKNALVMPFLSQVLGYDVFNPKEVIPEFTADTGTKKGEKVDYAISHDGDLQILIEAKKYGDSLSLKHASQLYRYFSVTNARIAILTNGTQYLFYSDLDDANRMDERPFLEVDLANLDEAVIPELQKLSKSKFNLDAILSSAGDMKYSAQIKRILQREFKEPSEELVKLLVGEVYDGKLTQGVKSDFQPIVKKAMIQFLRDRINERFQSAMSGVVPIEDTVDEERQEDEGNGIYTTDDEVEGYNLVKAIIRGVVAPERIIMRDTKSYCGILLDDNNRKPIARLHFNRSQKYLGLFDDNKNETRHAIDSVNDIFNFSDTLLATAQAY